MRSVLRELLSGFVLKGEYPLLYIARKIILTPSDEIPSCFLSTYEDNANTERCV